MCWRHLSCCLSLHICSCSYQCELCRSYLAAAACNGKIFALGGPRLSGEQPIYSASVEGYDTARDTWSYLDLPETFIKKRAFASAISVHSEDLLT